MALNSMRQWRTGAALVALLVAPAAAQAQYAPPPGPGAPPAQQRPPVPQPTPKAPAKAPAAAPKTAGETSSGTSDAGLRQRVEQLEEQLVDLQVVIGTLESMGRGVGAAAGARGPAVSSGADAGRIAALETQVQALISQVEQMSDQLRAARGGAAPAAAAGGSPWATRAQPGAPSDGFRANGPAPAAGGGFAAATVTPGGAATGDPIGQLIAQPDRRTPPAGVQQAALPPSSSPAAKPLYDAAYAQLLQQNYPGAEAGFTEFLQKFPGDELAANAQFWLGETYFVRGQWDQAATAFYKVAQTYGTSVKAPDSLAKLAMSFERKGNKQAACRALAELNTRFPSPPQHVRNWEQAERRKAGCT